MLLSVAVLFLLCPLSSLQSPTTLKRNTTGTGLTSAATVSLSSLPKPLAVAALNTKLKSQQSAPSSPKASPAKANLTLSSSSPSSPKASPAKANLTLSSSSPSSPKASPAKVNQTVSTSSSSSPKANSAKANLTLSSSSSSPKASPAKANLTLSSSSSSPKAKANQTVSSSSSAKPTPAPAVKVVKGKAAPHTHPIKVVITDGCAHKKETNSSTSSSSSSSSAVEKELTLKPGSPLVMTHHINLVPNSCTGGCEAEMAALKGRVEYLEKEMAAMKKMCTSCSAGSCPNSCSSQGRCEEGKCVCNAGFSGADCSVSATCPSNCNKKGKCVKGKCVCNPGLSGVDCSKGTEKKVKVTVETVTMKVTPESNAIKETTTTTIVKKTKADKTIFVKKPESDKEQKVSVAKKEEQGKGLEASQSKTKTTVKTSVLTKVTAKTPSATNGTKTGKVVKTVGQVFLKQAGRRPEQATKGKTEVKKIDTKVKVTTKQEAEKASLKKVQLKDQPFVNVTSVKKTNGTSKLLTQIVKDTKPSVNVTTVEKTVIKTTKVVKTTGTQATDGTVKVTVKTGATKVKPAVSTATTEKDKKVVQANATIVLKEGPVVKKKVESQLNVTTVESKVLVKQTNKTSSKWASSVVSVVAQNITSTSFILTWEASQGLFRNFTLSRRELAAGVEDKEEEVAVEEAEKGKLERQDVTVTGNITEVLKQSSNKTTTTTKVHVSTTSAKAEGKNVRKFTQVLPGTARTFQFRNLRPQTRYALSLFGTAPGFRSKIYRLTVTTGPEPPSELVFTNITETSVSVSWTKPRNTVTGFKVIYTNTATGVSGSLTMDSQLSTVVISKLSAGSSYEISVTSMLESSESDAVVATIITAPDSPTSLQAVNVTDTKALLVWKAAQAKVDRYILSYGSSKSPNVTVTVMLSGNTVEHQLRGLHRSTLYTVRLVSQLNSLQSSQVSTTFTTGSAVKVQSVAPSTVTSGSAVITWKAPHVAFKTYKLTYQLPGEQAKEVFLSPTVIQYELTGLLAGSNYTVKVEGEKEGNYVTVVSTEFTTGALPFHYPTDCSQVHLNGQRESGEAEIFPEGQEGEPVLVYCDMETDGGGWTVFQRRMDGKTDFFRGWKDYSKGFGFLSDEFWLGNDHVHALTSKTPMNLRVDLQVGNETAYAHYANFSLASEENNYTIHVSGYSGNAGDSLRYHSGRPFSTKDKDPQPLSIHCAKAYMGGWWYKNCYKANLNGLYGTFSENQGVVWIDWKGKDISIPFTEMKLRPASFHSVTQG